MKVITLNCRGLNRHVKRHFLFTAFNDYDIICLQETYITLKQIQLWKSEWSGDFFYKTGTSNSKGQIILINKRFSYEDLSEIQINDRCIGISFTASEKLFVILNLYVPSIKNERVDFLSLLTKKITNLNLSKDAHLILCGDMNMVLDNNLDIISGEPHPIKEIRCFEKFITRFNLIDCWRYKHQSARDYSWSRYNPFIARRLDYILCSKNLEHIIIHSEMTHFSSTDHKAIIAFFNIENFPRGPGKWYFNDLLLEDNDYDLKMKTHLSTHYDSLQHQTYSKSEIYDLLKISVRDESINFSRLKRVERSDLCLMNSEIQELNNKLISNPDDQVSIKALRNIIMKKEIYDLAKSKGAVKRSRAKFINDGEKNTKFYLGLEKSRQSKKIIRSIKDRNGTIVYSPNEILTELRHFSKTLMTAADEDDFDTVFEKLNTFLGDIDHPVLSEADKQYLEAPILIDELHSALKLLNFDSAPGEDGLTPAFYLHFWNLLKKPLHESLLESIQDKVLSISQRRALISLLYKGKDYDIQEIASWRPISLTNTDYKIYSKVLAIRVQVIIKKIISENQVAYIKGRSITDHLRLIDDIINMSNNENLPGFVVSLDFQKAFDTISKSAILAALKKINFGPIFLGYVQTILNGTEAAIKNGGWTSEFFSTSRGVRQGCCLSPLLFIIVVEILAIKIRHDPSISGILEDSPQCSRSNTKLFQYADDMNLLLKTIKCISRALLITDDFKSFTGLSLNRIKSIGMGLGPNKGIADQNVGITWKKRGENMRILGVFFNSGMEASRIKQNWEPKIEEIKKTIMTWSRRNHTLLGKCVIAKTFLLSKVAYILQSLSLPEEVLNEIDTILFRFLWKNKDINVRAHEKIKRSVLCLDSSEGGVNMISVKDQQKVMLIRWLQRGFTGTNLTQHKIINYLFANIGGLGYIINSNINSKKIQGLHLIKSHFWRSTIEAWIDLKKSERHNEYDIPIFNNNDILYKNKPLFIRRWIDNNCKYLHDFIKNGVPRTLNEIRNIVGNYGGLLPDYLAVLNAISKMNRNPNLPASCQNIPPEFKMENKTLRAEIVRQKNITICSIDFWKRKFNIDLNNYFSIARKCTKETKLRWLHLRLVHNIYPTNILLKKMYLKDTNLCDTCNNIDFIEHAFYHCEPVQRFWNHVSQLISTRLNIHFNISPSQAILGIPMGSQQFSPKILHEINHIILIAKLSIVKSKVSKNTNIKVNFEQEIELRKKYFQIIQC